jgi:hypothetical protein
MWTSTGRGRLLTRHKKRSNGCQQTHGVGGIMTMRLRGWQRAFRPVSSRMGAPSDGDHQFRRLMASTAIPRNGVHLFRAMASTSPHRRPALLDPNSQASTQIRDRSHLGICGRRLERSCPLAAVFQRRPVAHPAPPTRPGLLRVTPTCVGNSPFSTERSGRSLSRCSVLSIRPW